MSDEKADAPADDVYVPPAPTEPEQSAEEYAETLAERDDRKNHLAESRPEDAAQAQALADAISHGQ